MTARDDFRRALMDGDVRLLRRMWASTNPHLPQPQNAADGEVCLHLARTAATSIPLKLRAYSHRWLTERDYPSQLPNKLRSEAEQMYPRVAASVGFAWSSGSEVLRAAKPLVQQAVSARVAELYANGDGENANLIRGEMMATKNLTLKNLFNYRESPKEVTHGKG